MITDKLAARSALAEISLPEEQIEAAISLAEKKKIPVHKAVIQLGLLSEKQILQKLAQNQHSQFAELSQAVIQSQAVKSVQPKVATHYNIMPIKLQDSILTVVASDPFDHGLAHELGIVLGNAFEIQTVFACEEDIQKTIRKCYGLGAATVEKLTSAEIIDSQRDINIDLLDQELLGDASVIKLVNQILVDAIKADATDIHIEPHENHLNTRYRIDGLLHDAGMPPTMRYFRDGITSRIKIMSGLDIAEKRLPQDGRTQIKLGNGRYDLRISILPTPHGEAINIRILPQNRTISDLSSLGMDDVVIDKLSQLIHKPHGIILVTGPTGSGKTTTLYTCINMLKNTPRKIITIEDPIEYDMPGILQMQTHSQIGFTFAAALRATLRHDPDIMLVGEIRDMETAQTAIRTALTGHLIFSTLHTNDAASSITRLLDMGIEAFLLASSLDAILAQRLIRVICPNCKIAQKPEPRLEESIGKIAGVEKLPTCYTGSGCPKCHFTGYHGRTIITELLELSDKTREMTTARTDSNLICRQAQKEGMKTLFESGFEKLKKGITTCEELIRVTKSTVA